MSTNQDRAAEVIFREFGKFAPGFPVGAIADDLAQALADAGLLTPDLPAREWIDADRLRAVLARLDSEYATVAASNPRPGRDQYTAGYLTGVDTAYTWLQKALEGTHE